MTEANARIVLDEEGMPNKRTGGRGKLVLNVRIQYPKDLPDKVLEYLNEHMPGPRSIVLDEAKKGGGRKHEDL